MHAKQAEFLEQMGKDLWPYVSGGNVAEFGSFNVNGSLRHFFPGWKLWIGIDLNEPECWGGKGHPCDCGDREPQTKLFPCVQMLGDTANLSLPDESFDVVISSNHLEHDPSWEESIREAHRILQPGGVFVLSTVTPVVKPHELWTTGHYNDFYADDINAVLHETFIREHIHWVSDAKNVEDIQVWARKTPDPRELGYGTKTIIPRSDST